MKRTWISSAVTATAVALLTVGSVSTGHAERLVSKLKGPNAPAAAAAATTESGSPEAVDASRQAADTPAYEKNKSASDQPVAIDVNRLSAMGRLAHLATTGGLDRALARARAQRDAALKGHRALDFKVPGDAEGGDDDLDNPAGGQAETSIAVDSTGMHIVVGINDTRGFSLNPVSVSGFQYSDDGGATFVDGGQLPVNTGTSAIGATLFPEVFGDPEVKYLGGSTFVYFSIMVKKIGTAGQAQTMCMHRSTDYGHTWTGPFEVPPATNPHGLLSGPNARDAADKEFAAVDPDTGRVLMSWSNFTSFAAGGVEISTTFSDDVLTTTGTTPPTWSARQIVANAAPDGQGSFPRFAGNGSNNAYIVWSRFFTFGYFNTVGFARSTDNGASWSVPVDLTPSAAFFTMDYVLGNDRVHNFPSLAVDNSPGVNKGNVYVVVANNDNGDGADISFQRSIDGGLSFSTPILLNSRTGLDRAQWFPSVNVDKDTGRVYVFYYDQGIADNGDLTETTYLFSDDGGTTWSKPMPLSDRPFHAGWGNDTGQPNLGDYNQAVAQNGELFVVWAGTELKGFADGQPSASMTTPDVFFKRAPAVKTSVDLGTVTFTDGNGNGFIDAGEQVRFKMPLRNYDTNPLHAGGVTGITGTLSTTTPGVTVTTATSTYPNLAPGASAVNATDYVLQLSPSFVSGVHIELALAVSSAQGTNTLLFTQATGTPGTTILLSENFDGVAPGVLPPGWQAAHGAGSPTVPWTTNNTFLGTTSNAAFHINTGSPTRFERLFSPLFTVPANAEYVTVDMDVAYDTEDDPNFNILAYDGFFLRVTDMTVGRTLRSVLAEAFEEELTTGALQHYPKHWPRNSSGSYFPNGDMSVWAGDSAGFKHVHMKFPGAGGLAGATAQLRFEFAQDSSGSCTDVRPTHTQCGVMFDNLVVQSVASVQAEAALWIGLKNSDDVGTNFDVKAELFRNGSPVPFGSGQVNNVRGGSSGFNNAIQRTFDIALSALDVTFAPGDTVSIKVSVRAGATGHRSGTARLWYNDSAANSHFDFTIGGVTTHVYLLDGLLLGMSPGGSKKTIDVFVDRLVGGNPFKPFGTWTKTF